MRLKTRRNIVKIYRFLTPDILKNKVKKFYFMLEGICIRIKWFFFYGTTDYFSNIAIEISTYCQLRCSICPNSIHSRGLKENKVEMHIDVISKILTDLKGFRGNISYARFNEPLTDNRLDTIIRLTKKLLPKSKVFINTNGLLLTEKRYDELVEAGVDEILATDYVGNKPMKRIKGVTHRYLDENMPLLNRVGMIATKVKADLPCQAEIRSAIVINVDGNLLKCCNDYFSKEIFGNVKKENLLDIWFNEKFRDTREQLKKQNFDYSELCRKCVA